MQTFTDLQTVLTEKQLLTDRSAWSRRLEQVTSEEVERALRREPGHYSLARLVTLLSPAAQAYLEPMAQQAHDLTRQRFGKTIGMYAPLYVSNVCVNRCRYCGFNCDSPTPRRRLTLDEAVAEAEVIRAEGFTDLLLVSSEDRQHVTIDYLCELARRLRGMFSSLTIEIHQLERDEYARLFDAGIEGVTLYQETYNADLYREYHLSGPKADFARRLRAFDDAGGAGMRQLGLGVLLGLTDWRLETLSLGEHGHVLMKRYWRSRVSFSFPRLRPASDVDRERFAHMLSDRDLVQMILALRLCFADAGLVLSTRESAQFRDHAVHLGITRLSAGSKTNPGGYSQDKEALEQFQIDDDRTPAQVAQMLKSQGLEAVWKDWDTAFIQDSGCRSQASLS